MATTVKGEISAVAQGESNTVFFNITTEDGDIIDISADTIKFTAKENDDDADPGVFQKDADMSGGASGVAVLYFLATETAPIDPGSYDYDVVWTRSNGEVKIIQRGTWTVTGRVSDV